MIATGFIGELEGATETKLPGPAALMEYFLAGGPPEKVQECFSANHDLAEWWIYSENSEVPLATRLGRAFAIWAQLHAKWRRSEDVPRRLWIVRARMSRH
jgi:hypothetical protein